ncbi:peptide chain release factor H [Pseudoalteromonas sp. T1lg65]|uniref:peptide chain release factor H n=1 Tax=Pseudoalteromonas sp. T1lg65 TaxID=2077101 RepID=UPI003F7B0387
MILLQLSAGKGPAECGKAVALALQLFEQQANTIGAEYTILSQEMHEQKGCIKSVLIQLAESARRLAEYWHGPLLWVNPSPFRIKHKRKNWFFSGKMMIVDEVKMASEIRFQTCRASGAGGQHVNTTDSAVRATHIASGLSVRVESERSQHANKRVAKALLLQKIAEQSEAIEMVRDKARWQQHQALQRGDPKCTFKGNHFVPTTPFICGGKR